MRKILKLLLLLAIATAIYEIVPRMLPSPVNPHSFGGEDVLFLQDRLSSRYFDIFMLLVYSLGYIMMIYGTGIYIFLKRDAPRLERYLAVFIFVQSISMLTWWLFPVAPPRMAVNGVREVRREMFGISEVANPYPYGAFPSLHVANSLSATLFVRSYGRRIFAVWVIVFILLTFSTIYLGEHYWQDIVGGMGYSLAGYLAVKFLAKTNLGKKIFEPGEM